MFNLGPEAKRREARAKWFFERFLADTEFDFIVAYQLAGVKPDDRIKAYVGVLEDADPDEYLD